MTAEKEKAADALYNAGLNMRKAQRDYFKLRTQQRLYAAKEAEDEFDRALRDYCRGSVTASQPVLI